MTREMRKLMEAVESFDLPGYITKTKDSGHEWVANYLSEINELIEGKDKEEQLSILEGRIREMASQLSSMSFENEPVEYSLLFSQLTWNRMVYDQIKGKINRGDFLNFED